MSKRLTLKTVLLAVVVSFLALSASAQENSSSSANELENVQFRIKTKTGAAVFRIGEVIPLELSFSSSTEKTYQVNMAAYDRSGRMFHEKFLIEPDSGWRDPLRNHVICCFGGLSTSRMLSQEPIVISLQLNEWVRFESPGRYRLRLNSDRVSNIKHQSGSTFPFPAAEPVTSNELELTIIPATKEWQEQSLREATETIDRLGASSPVGAQSQASELLQTAVKTLRYLGTATAVQEMARRLKDDDNARDFSFGVIGSPERETALKEMEWELNPDYPITDNFLSTMSVLSLDPDQAPEARPGAQQQAYEQIRAQLWEAIPKKRGMAKSISLVTAAFSQTNEKLSEEAIQQLVENFDSLPTQKQEELIEYRWDDIKNPVFLPVLRKYARQYQDFPILNESNAYASIHLSGAALQHWYESAPEEARAAVFEEILRPRPRFDAHTLGLLRDKALPEIEQTLVERLRSSDDFQISGNLASLLERYGTKAVLPQMLSIIDEKVGKWACAVQEPALAYLLRG